MHTAAILVAGASAAGFALSTSLQHQAADRAPERVQGAGRLLLHLMTRPWWLVGQALALVSFTLHAAALRLGSIVLVQPVVVSGIVLAVPVRAALERRLPSRGELGTVALTAAGLALFLVAARPGAGAPATGTGAAAVLAAVAVVTAAAAAWRGGRTAAPRHAGGWYGVAAGILFGVVAGLVKLTLDIAGRTGTGAADHVLAAAGSWSAWGVVVVGLSGVALNQRAYRVAPLPASMPVLNIVNVLVALLFGLLVFGETPAHTPWAVAGEAVALLCMMAGLRRLSQLESAPVAPVVPVASRPG